jgi:DNA helicase-2/ATP-dependent DNA helicase PcrA
VLCRTNAQLAVIEQALHGSSIPFRVRGGVGLLDQPEVRTALRELERHRGELATALADLADEPRDAPVEADSRAANLEALARLGHDYLALESRPSPAGFVAWLRETTRADQPDDQGDAVALATFHAAKGLEWPIVHLAGLEQGLVPIGHARTPDDLAEERRLLYVALTRAERELHLTWARSRTFGERTSSRTRSPYLDQVDAATEALERGEIPADWARHLAGQRATLRLRSPASGGAPKRKGAAAKRAGGAGADQLDDDAKALYDALRQWRTTQARAADVPAYVVFQDRVLIDLARARPRTRAELLSIAGIGPVKADRFGDQILGIVAGAAAS